MCICILIWLVRLWVQLVLRPLKNSYTQNLLWLPSVRHYQRGTTIFVTKTAVTVAAAAAAAVRAAISQGN